jgi:prefoldin subunit 5
MPAAGAPQAGEQRLALLQAQLDLLQQQIAAVREQIAGTEDTQ